MHCLLQLILFLLLLIDYLNQLRSCPYNLIFYHYLY
nr:MAG TPA: hypothetical protein [Caudoviricetes sp.]DAW04243.1 MAG TPA: hypothetical protein [Caudoviricetes sp.]